MVLKRKSSTICSRYVFINMLLCKQIRQTIIIDLIMIIFMVFLNNMV